MNTEFYEYILRERGRRDVDEDKDDSMCASLPHVYSPAQPARGTVSRRLRSTHYAVWRDYDWGVHGLGLFQRTGLAVFQLKGTEDRSWTSPEIY